MAFCDFASAEDRDKFVEQGYYYSIFPAFPARREECFLSQEIVMLLLSAAQNNIGLWFASSRAGAKRI